MKRSLLLALGVLTVSTIMFSCSKATSKPQYKYRKSVGDGVAATFGGLTVSDKELYDGLESDLYDLEMKKFELKFNKLNALILEKLMKNDPKSKGLTNDQYMDKFIASKIKITEKEIEQFIIDRKVPKNQVNPQIKQKIKDFLAVDKKRQAVQMWIGEKTAKDGIKVFFQKPQRPSYDVKAGNAPFVGGADAKVTIVEYSDFQCPFCAKGATVITELKKKYGKKIKVAFKQYPLPFHTQAKMAAVASLCANEQGSDKFWNMHDKMFADQTKLAVPALKETAKSLGLKTDQFDKCLDGKKYLNQVELDIAEGKRIGVKSTPTFYVNGKLVSGAQPLEIFSEIIDQELSL